MVSDYLLSIRLTLLTVMLFIFIYVTIIQDKEGNDTDNAKSSQNIYILLMLLVLGLYIEMRDMYISASMKKKELDENLELFDADEIEKLNSLQNTQGRFYVDCGKCGRSGLRERILKSNTCYGSKCGCGCGSKVLSSDKKLIEESKTYPYGKENICGRYKAVGPDNNHNHNHNHNNHNKDVYRCNNCSDIIGRDTLSLYNDNYIDVNNVQCYNCALDLRAKVEEKAINYRELPASNGPPGYSIYLDAGYSY